MSFMTIRKLMATLGMHAHRGASLATLHLFEQTHGIRLPDQVKEYYSIMNGREASSNGPLSLMMPRLWPIPELSRQISRDSLPILRRGPFDFYKKIDS